MKVRGIVCDIISHCLLVQATIGAIVPGGAAYLDGRLQVGDEITHINSLNVMNATHREVIELMGEAGAHGEVSLNIRRKLPPADSGYPSSRYCIQSLQRHLISQSCCSV